MVNPVSDPPKGIAIRTIPQAELCEEFADLAKPRAHLENEAQIRNVLTLYTFVVDAKRWDMLDLIFYEQAWVNYSALLGSFQPLDALKEAMDKILQGTTTQHSLGTPAILVAEDQSSARSATYFSASHFGTGKMWGEGVWSWGTYEDYWLRDETSGQWKIIQRTLMYPGENGNAPLYGNVGIFNGGSTADTAAKEATTHDGT